MGYKVLAAFVAAAFVGCPAFAQAPTTPDTFKFLTPDQLEGVLPPGHKGGFMARHENYMSEFVDRTDSGNLVEVHDHLLHFIEIVSGEGTLTYGGTVAQPKEVSPGEIRGDAITGGTSISLHPGDYLQIPPGTPHLFNAIQGGHIRYFVVSLRQ